MTRQEMESEVSRLLLVQRRLARFSLQLPPNDLMLLRRLLYRLGLFTSFESFNGLTRMSRNKEIADRINRAVVARLARRGLTPNDPGVIRYTEEQHVPPTDSTTSTPNPSDPPTPATPEQGHNGDSPAAEDWDGSIDEDEVRANPEPYREDAATFDRWSRSGEHMPQRVHLESGIYHPPGRESPINVFRWYHEDHDGARVEEGEWTPDDVEADSQADQYATDNNEDPPDPDDDDIPNDISGRPWGRRESIASYHSGGEDHDVRLEQAWFEFGGQEHEAYRWTTRRDSDGSWTLDRERAIEEGEQYAADNHEEPEPEGIHPYSYKPVYEPLGEKGPYYGAELETQLKESSPISLGEAAQQTLDTLNSGYGDEEFAYLKEDSSIESGSPHTGKGTFEIVTQPATLQVHKEQWAPFFANPPKGLISHDANAGLHIHVGRENLSTLGIGKMVYFINHPANKDFLTKLARRESPQWAAMDPNKKPKDVGSGRSRRVALNLMPSHTVEFRLFRGTFKPESFFAAMEFVDALVNLSKPGMVGVEEMADPRTLFRYVATFHKDYPNLLNFLEGFTGEKLVSRGPRKMARFQMRRIPVPMSVSIRFGSSTRRMSRSTRSLPLKKASVTGQLPIRYAKIDGHQKAHPLVEGFPIEHALRHLANDPKNSDDLRNTARLVLTGDEKGNPVPEAMWVLHDQLQEHENGDGTTGHPILKAGYNWLSAADKMMLDQHTYTAMKEFANRRREGAPHDNHEQWAYQPEHVAEEASRGTMKRPEGVPQYTHDRAKNIAESLRYRVKQLSPHTPDKDIDESIRRHAFRAHKVWKDRMVTTGAKVSHPTADEYRRRAVDHPSARVAAGQAWKDEEKATRYARLTIGKGEPLMGGQDFMHEIHDETGKRVGHLWVTPMENGTRLHVNHVGAMGHEPNSLGPSVIRDAKRQLKAHYPNAKRITGTRISGATHANTGQSREVSLRMRRAVVEKPKRYGTTPTPHDRVAQDFQMYRQSMRPRMHPSRYGTPWEHELFHDYVTQRGLKVQKSDYNYYDSDTHTLYHENPGDKGAVAKEYLRWANRPIRLSRQAGINSWWMAPDGTLHDVDYGRHREWITKNRKLVSVEKGDPQANDYMDHAYNKGWVRVSHFGKTITAENPKTQLSSNVLKALKDHAISRGAEAVEIYGPKDQPRQQVRLQRRSSLPVKKYSVSFRGDFIDSLRRIKSKNQKALHETAKKVARELGLHPVKLLDALHDTPRGATPGLAQGVYGMASPEQIHAAASWIGLTGNLPGVAVFHPRPNGPDTLYRFRQDGAGLDIRSKLDRAGLRDRVLVPHRKGFDVLIPDEGNQLLNRVKGYVKTHKVTLEASPGHFKMIGSMDQANARDQFRGKVVNAEQGDQARLQRQRGLRRFGVTPKSKKNKVRIAYINRLSPERLMHFVVGHLQRRGAMAHRDLVHLTRLNAESMRSAIGLGVQRGLIKTIPYTGQHRAGNYYRLTKLGEKFEPLKVGKPVGEKPEQMKRRTK